MATMEELATALRNADAAGDTAAATQIAGAIRHLQANPAPSGGQPGMWESAGRGIMQGLTLGAGDEAYAAGAGAIAKAQGQDFMPAYEQQLAQTQRNNRAASEANPWTYGIGQVAGAIPGLVVGGSTALGGKALGLVGRNLLTRSIASGASGGALGAVQGFAGTDGSVADRVKGGVSGAVIGGATGAATPGLIAGASKVTQPVRDAINAQFRPEAFAQQAAANALGRARVTPDELRTRLAAALADQQPEYLAADAMGDGGARALNSITRGNSPTASAAKELLDTRQAGQGGRIINNVDEAFSTNGRTAGQTRDTITAMRDAEANANYGAIRNAQGTNGIWSPELQDLTSRPSVQRAIGEVVDIAKERGHSVTNPFVKQADGTFALPQGVEPGFSFWDNVKRGIDAQLRKDPGNRDLNATKAQLLQILDAQVPGYKAARAPYREASEAADAIKTGRDAATRGRSEDTIRAQQAMTPAQKIGHRAGYADRHIETTQGAADGVNKARPLLNDATRAEFPVFAQTSDKGEKLLRQLVRENEMFGTRATATGGSQTANNLRDLMTEAGAGAGAGGFIDYLRGGSGVGGAGLGMALAMGRRGVNSARFNPSNEAQKRLADALLSNNADDILSLAARRVSAGQMSGNRLQALIKALSDETRQHTQGR